MHLGYDFYELFVLIFKMTRDSNYNEIYPTFKNRENDSSESELADGQSLRSSIGVLDIKCKPKSNKNNCVTT